MNQGAKNGPVGWNGLRPVNLGLCSEEKGSPIEFRVWQNASMWDLMFVIVWHMFTLDLQFCHQIFSLGKKSAKSDILRMLVVNRVLSCMAGQFITPPPCCPLNSSPLHTPAWDVPGFYKIN